MVNCSTCVVCGVTSPVLPRVSGAGGEAGLGGSPVWVHVSEQGVSQRLWPHPSDRRPITAQLRGRAPNRSGDAQVCLCVRVIKTSSRFCYFFILHRFVGYACRNNSALLKCFAEGGDVVQGGRGEERNGVSSGLPAETHGAEGGSAEERRGGAQGGHIVLHVFMERAGGIHALSATLVK